MKIQRLAMASMKGNSPPGAANKMMRHYRLALDLVSRKEHDEAEIF